MRSLLWLPALAVVFALVSIAAAQENGQTPKFQLVAKVQPESDAFILTAEREVAVQVPVQVPKTILENGVAKTVFEIQLKTVTKVESSQVTWLMTNTQAFDGAGNKLTREELFKRMQPGTAVLVLPPGQKLQPAFQRLLNKDAIVLSANVQP